jgi:hypothetical protein
MVEGTRKLNPLNLEYEMRAKNLLKGELKRRGVTHGNPRDRAQPKQ